MLSKTYILTLIAVLLFSITGLSQANRKDTGVFVEKKNEFWDKIESENEKFAEGVQEPEQKFIMNFEGIDLPTSKEEFKYYWHNDPISQGNSGMCWSFSTTSFYESEIYRLHSKKIKLSELYTVYWEYVEKARRFVREHGDSFFGEGGLGNHFPFIWEVYGIVPAKDYTGLKENQPFHDHSRLFEEMESYLNYVKENNAWNEEQVIETIKSILNYHIGEPPKTILVDGKKMTPLEYFKNVVKIDFTDYVDFMSLMEKPYGQQAEYEVPDNWWHSAEYYNVDLDKFMAMIKTAIKNGYTLYIGGDTGEPGYYSYKEAAMVPTFDIPSEYIDENARQFRFSNESTTDDHGIHIVGYKEKDGKYWFLIKDSGSGSRNGPNKGYYFYHEDYVKLKIMNFTVHKDAVKDMIDF